MLIKHLPKNRRAGYSLLEVLVTLLIVNIVVLMLSNIMVISIKSSIKIGERSFTREELTTISNKIKKDIRNTGTVEDDCLLTGGSDTCTLNQDVEIVRWSKCSDSICRYTLDPNDGQYKVTFQSSPKIVIDTLSFQEQPTEATNTVSLLVTITANHSNPNLDLNNLYRQFIITTRNISV